MTREEFLKQQGYKYVMICPKCGGTSSGITKDGGVCIICGKANVIPTDYDIHTYICSSGNQSQLVREHYGMDKLDPECVKIREEFEKSFGKKSYSQPKYTPVIECPYCHSTNTTKITTAQKAVNTALFGIFGNKRKHQWHCNNCKSDF